MSVKVGANGERSVEAEVEVPGSPEEVWRAIATGRGISAWLGPTTSEERVGGTVVSESEADGESVATITAWNKPIGFSTETEEGPGTVTTDWTVEPRANGTCIVRVVQRCSTDSDTDTAEWDVEFEGRGQIWQACFDMLRLYLTHFADQPGIDIQLVAFNKASASETWRIVRSAFVIDEEARTAVTRSRPVHDGAAELATPELAGTIETARATYGATGELLLRLDRPAPGFAHLFVMAVDTPGVEDDTTMVAVNFFLYGEEGADAAAEVRSDWSAWLARRFSEGAAG